jgi:hypothetical protein
MAGFTTKAEVDAWYVAAMDGVGRAGVLNARDRKDGITDYLVAETALAAIRDDAYRQLGIPLGPEPPKITTTEAIRKHYPV